MGVAISDLCSCCQPGRSLSGRGLGTYSLEVSLSLAAHSKWRPLLWVTFVRPPPPFLGCRSIVCDPFGKVLPFFLAHCTCFGPGPQYTQPF